MAFLTSSDKALWHLALPMIFSNITVPLLGLVDTAVICDLDSPGFFGGGAGGGNGASFFFFFVVVFRNGTTRPDAQAFGGQKTPALSRVRG